MSDSVVHVVEDPAHPEGGHALFLFEGVTARPNDARFQVESLVEDAQAWPEHLQVPVSVAVTERGLEIVAGPEIGNAILEGTPVAIALPAAGLHGEVLWPSITPLVLNRNARGGMHAAPRRSVVSAEAQDVKGPVLAQPREAIPQRPEAKKPPPVPIEPVRPEPAPAIAVLSESDSTGKTNLEDARPRLDAAPVPGLRRLALVAAAAFLAGIGSVLAYAAAGGSWPFQRPEPTPVQAPVQASGTPLPSLYDALVLAPASPRGLRMDGKTDAYARAKAAWGGDARPKDGAEAAYWLRAIVKDSMPDNLAKSFSALGHLALKGDGVAQDPALAMLFLEFAAIGGRCDAAAALADGIEPPDKWRAVRWHGIAEKMNCPEPRKR